MKIPILSIGESLTYKLMKKRNYYFIQDLFRENRGGKYSSKKFWGHIIMLLVSITYVMDGFDFFEVDHHLFDSALIAGGYFLGMSVLNRALPKRNVEAELDKTVPNPESNEAV